MNWKNLAPSLVRQRVVIEATTKTVLQEAEIKTYLQQLSEVVGMRPLQKPFAYVAEEMGYGGWIHWVTSGAHVYTYTPEATGGKPLFTVDAYTCKPFSVKKAVEFTREFLGTDEIAWKEIEV